LYWFSQNSYLGTATGFISGATVAANTCAGATIAAQRSATFIGTRVASNCSGDFNQGSFLIDYTVNRHFDIYAGVTFTEQTGGLNSGFLEVRSHQVVSWATQSPNLENCGGAFRRRFRFWRRMSSLPPPAKSWTLRWHLIICGPRSFQSYR